MRQASDLRRRLNSTEATTSNRRSQIKLPLQFGEIFLNSVYLLRKMPETHQKRIQTGID
jgi:hypothetical protein